MADAVRGARLAPVGRLLEGAALGIALWCILFSFQLLPTFLADTWGVLIFGIAGMVVDAAFHRTLVATLVIAAAVVVVVTLTPLTNAIASRWVRTDRFSRTPVDAAVVLSGTVNPNTTMGGNALDNMLFGLQLVRAGRAGALVTTTVEQKFPGESVSSVVDQARIMALAGSQVRWLRTAPTGSTRDEAVRSAELLIPLGIRRIAVVAAPMHTRRACSTFEAVGFVVTCIPSLVRSPGAGNPGPWPADRLRVFGDWVYEVIATLKYRAAGWLGHPLTRAA
jgi:uncharacterized SAM-binding protein YcdF (DUF218 family)